MADAARSITELFSFLGPRRAAEDAASVERVPATLSEAVYPTKALQKFLAGLRPCDNPLILDLGPVVGSNVTFFGEQLGCRIRVEDLAADLDRHARDGKLAELARFFATRFTQAPESVDGILCWDAIDYLDRPAAQALADALCRLLRPGGRLLGFFSTAEPREQTFTYTKYVVVDEATLRYRTCAARCARQRSLLNGDIIRLFGSLRVTDSFLMKSHVREMLFKKPAPRV
jgi:hypothetical protein